MGWKEQELKQNVLLELTEWKSGIFFKEEKQAYLLV